MARYDWTYDRGFASGARRPRIWGRGDAYFEHGGGDAYDRDMTPAREWVRGGHGLGGQYGGRGYLDGGRGGYDRGLGRGFERDRGVYGGAYPQFGGVPGSRREGMSYGGGGGGELRHPDTLRAWQPRGWGGQAGAMGRPEMGPRWSAGGYDAGYAGGFGRGYDRGMGRGGMRPQSYGGDFAREPFMPEAAYLRHPEYETPSTYHQDRWERPGEYVVERAEPPSDEEIRDEVRQRLYQDTWLRADDIEVTVSGGVVTLRGEVHDFLEARYAWDDAWESDGVRGVINNLTVRPDEGQPHGDTFAQHTEGGTG
ncbi:MAG: BON domain-containing protein [Gemmatimonadota bacterium]